MKVIKIRFYQYSKKDFTVEVKGFWGWTPLYLYGGAFCISEHFPSKIAAINQVKSRMKNNPTHVRFHECATIIIHW